MVPKLPSIPPASHVAVIKKLRHNTHCNTNCNNSEEKLTYHHHANVVLKNRTATVAAEDNIIPFSADLCR